MTNPTPTPDSSSTERSSVKVYNNDSAASTTPAAASTPAVTGEKRGIGVYDAPDRPAGNAMLPLIIGVVAVLVVLFLLFQFVF